MLGASVHNVRDDWDFARMWLQRGSADVRLPGFLPKRM